MANVQAVSKATDSQLQELKKAALDAAAATRFDTSQATEGLYAMASAGFTVEEQLKGLRPVLDLAAATAGDLGTAAEQVVIALRGFQIDAGEAGRVADVLTAATQASALNAERLTGALANSSAISNAYQQELEGTVAALGILTTALSDGNNAGTALSGTWIQMLDKSEALGISIKDQEGKILPLIEIIRRYEAAGVSATEAMEAFGARGGKGISILLSAGSQALEEMESKLQSNGQAAAVAAAQMDNLAGDVTVLGSVWDVFLVTLGETGGAGARGVIQGLTVNVQELSAWVRRNREDIVGFVDGLFKTISFGISVSVDAGKALFRVGETLVDLGKAAAAAAGPIALGILVTKITALGGAAEAARLAVLGLQIQLLVFSEKLGAIAAGAASSFASILSGVGVAIGLIVLEEEQFADRTKGVDAALRAVTNTTGTAMAMFKQFTHRLSDEQIPALQKAAQQQQVLNQARLTALQIAKEQLEAEKREVGGPSGGRTVQRDVERLNQVKAAIDALSEEMQVQEVVIKRLEDARFDSLVKLEEELRLLGLEEVAIKKAIKLSEEQLKIAEAQDKIRKAMERTRDEAERLAKAHADGEAEVRRVTRELEVENRLIAAGLPITGEFADEMKRLAEETSGFADAVERAKTLDELTRAIQEEIRALDLETQARRKGKDALIDYQVAQAVWNRVKETGITLTKEETAELEENIKRLQDLTRASEQLKEEQSERTKRTAATTKTTGEMFEIWKNFTENVQRQVGTTFADIFRGELDNWRDFTDRILDMFFDMLSQMVAKAAASKLTFGTGSTESVFTDPATAGTGQRLLRSNGTGGAGQQAGQGIAIGAAAGSYLGNLAGNQAGYADAGALIGAAIGAALGTWVFPGIGTKLGAIIGGALGGLIGGLIKRGAERANAEIGVSMGKFTVERVEGGDLVEMATGLGRAAVDSLNAFAARFGGTVNSLTDEILINVINGEWFEVWVNGVKLMFSDVAEEAVEAATIAALKAADISGLSDVMQAVIDNTKAVDFEGLEADLEIGRAIEQILEGAAFDIRDGFLAIKTLMEEAARLGIDAALRADALAIAVAGVRDSILGISDEGFGGRLDQARQFNEDLQELINETVSQMADLQKRIEAAKARDFISDVDVDRPISDLGRDVAQGLADQMGMTVEQLQEEFDSLQALLDSLPDLIDLSGFAERLIMEFGALDNGVSAALFSIHETADNLRQSVLDLGLDAAETARLLGLVAEAEERRVQLLELDVLTRFSDLLARIPGQEEEVARMRAQIDQARFQIEIEMVAVQLEALGLMTDVFADMLDMARNWAEELANFRVPQLVVPQVQVGGGGGSTPSTTSIPVETISTGQTRAQRIEQKRRDVESLIDFLLPFEMEEFDLGLLKLLDSFKDAREEAERLGISIERVEEAQAKAIEEYFAQLIDPLVDLRNDLLTGDLSPLGPAEKFAQVQAEFEDLRRRALEGDAEAIRDLPEAANAFLDEAALFFGTSSGAFQDIFNSVIATLDQIIGDDTIIDAATQAVLDQLASIEQTIIDVAGAGGGGGGGGGDGGDGGVDNPPPPPPPPPGDDGTGGTGGGGGGGGGGTGGIPAYPEPPELTVFGSKLLQKLQTAEDIAKMQDILTNIWHRNEGARAQLVEEVFSGISGVFGKGDAERLLDSGLINLKKNEDFVAEVLARQHGGAVPPGRMFLAGEAGPEIGVSGVGFNVRPNDELQRFLAHIRDMRLELDRNRPEPIGPPERRDDDKKKGDDSSDRARTRAISEQSEALKKLAAKIEADLEESKKQRQQMKRLLTAIESRRRVG